MCSYITELYQGQQYDKVFIFLSDNFKSNRNLIDEYLSKINQENTILVREENKILAVCRLDFGVHESRGQTLDIDIQIGQSYSKKDILYPLYQAIEPLIISHHSQFVVTSCNANDNDSIQFWNHQGFMTWFVLKTMVHDSRSINKHELKYRNYQDSDFEMYFKGLGDAFEPMRRAMDISPYNVSHVSSEKMAKERKAFIEESSKIFIFFDKESYVGTAILDDNEIDDLYVCQAFQGQGYGRKILETIMHIAMEKCEQPMRLTVVDWNVKAKKLYHSVGFNVIKTKIFFRKMF